MREIKFRIWVPKFQKFLRNYINSKDDGIRIVGVFNSLHTLPYMMVSSEYVTQQYTGLKDKNEVEIYEGDIQKFTNGKHYSIYVVDSVGEQFGNCLFSLSIEDNFSTDDDGEYTYEPRIPIGRRNYIKSGKSIEVIGNIFENPELLTSIKN